MAYPAPPSLQSILEQSQRLLSLSHTPQGAGTTTDLPQIQLGLDQIESQSRRIAGRSSTMMQGQGDAQGENAYYLLASGGVNASLLSTQLSTANLTGTFSPLLPLSDTDVEGYLRHTHEQTIISAIEEGRRSTSSDFYRTLEGRMRKEWERQKENLFEELGRHSAAASSAAATAGGGADRERERERRKGAASGGGGGFDRSQPTSTPISTASTLQMHSRMMRYDRVIRRLNEYRKQGYAFGLISALGEASVSLSGDSKAPSMNETWRLLACLVRERDVLDGEFQRTSLGEREFARAYLGEEEDRGAGRTEVKKMVGEGARSFLEEQFMKHVEKTLATRPAEANLGGVPSMQNKIRGYLNVKYLKNGQWSNPALEIVNSTPVWARLYYLLRCGAAKEALTFALENEAALAGLEKSFVPYFKAWLDSPDRRLPKLLRDRFLSEYNQRIRYLTSTSDPYKHALYKLLGRVEITRRNVPGVTQTTEDWMWFQLCLVREDEADGPEHEKFGLKELGNVLVGFGEKHFDPQGRRPVAYFQVLLLCGQFERAIGFLHQHSAYQTDAVHFAIALSYYGLLRLPPLSSSSSNPLDLLTLSPDPAINFPRLLHRYTRAFVHSDTAEALQYLYLIALNADLEGERGREQVRRCREEVRDVVGLTRRYRELLGEVRADGVKVPGMIERDLKLVKLASSESYLTDIVKTAAQLASLEHRFSDALLLYNLAEEYDAVIDVLNVELGNSLGLGQGQGKGGEIVEIAKGVLEHYEKKNKDGTTREGKRKRESCSVLVRVKEALGAWEEGALERALQMMESVNLIPLDSDLVHIIAKSDEFKSLDENIVRNFDVILLVTMKVIFGIHQKLKESPFGDAGRSAQMNELRLKARSLMTFAGMLRFRLTSETYAALTRLDVFIH